MMKRSAGCLCLAAWLTFPAFANWAFGADASTPEVTAAVKERVELFGVGAPVKVKQIDGQKTKGIISSISDTGFALTPEAGGPDLQIGYDQTAEMKLASKKYFTSGSPDVAEARRVIAALGPGKHVMIRTPDTKIHGQIVSVDRDYFVILPDDRTDMLYIQYQDVQQAGKNLGIFSTIGVIVVVIVVVAIISWTR